MRTSSEKTRVPHSQTGWSVWRWIRLLYFLIFISGACLSGYIFYDLVHGIDLTANPFDVSFLPAASDDFEQPAVADDATAAPFVVQPGSATQSPGAVQPIPKPAAARPTPTGAVVAAGAAGNPENSLPRWDHMGRVNFLLLGVDLRPGEKGGFNTDSIIIVTLDPATKLVGMLSLPRDLWVQIPGYGENRINTAFYLGVRRKYPGGGPGLLKKTIQDNLGIPIHYYALINFVGFKKLVDALGGLTIDVPKDIYDPTFPSDNYGYKPLRIAKGRQHMTGQQALDYARTRHVDNDFGRMKRQQQVLMAIKDQALRIDVLTKIPALWLAKDNVAQTDLTLQDVFTLAQMARDIKADGIQNAVIGDAETQDWTTPSGAMVLLPDRSRIRKVVEPMFRSPASASAMAQQPGDQVKQ
jgi:LCP family protein required for cell wall assembly